MDAIISSLEPLGLAYICIVIGIGLGCAMYCALYYFVVEPMIKIKGMPLLEVALQPALLAAFVPPAGLFLPSDRAFIGQSR